MIYHESLNAAGKFLLLATKGSLGDDEMGDALRLSQEIGDELLLRLATDNQMVPLVADLLQRIQGRALGTQWTQVLALNQSRVERLIAALESVTAELTEAGCPSAAIEAGGVMLGTRLPHQAYCSGDIDLLVEASDWATVCDTFESMGFVNKDRRERPTKRIEYHRQNSDGSEQWLEVGFAPFDRMWVPLDYQDRCEYWLSKRVPSTKSDAIPVLHPNHALVFVAFHTSLHSYIRAPGLRLQVDVDRLVRDCEIDWDEVVAEVRAAGISNRVFMSFSMARGLLQTPIPDEVLSELAPSRAKYSVLLKLLQDEGVISNESGKLGRLRAVLLDMLISERPIHGWVGNVLFPNEIWMREHFEREGDSRRKTWQLHAKRFMSLASRWRPE